MESSPGWESLSWQWLSQKCDLITLNSLKQMLLPMKLKLRPEVNLRGQIHSRREKFAWGNGERAEGQKHSKQGTSTLVTSLYPSPFPSESSLFRLEVGNNVPSVPWFPLTVVCPSEHDFHPYTQAVMWKTDSPNHPDQKQDVGREAEGEHSGVRPGCYSVVEIKGELGYLVSSLITNNVFKKYKQAISPKSKTEQACRI